MSYLRKHYRDLIALSFYCVLTIAMTWTMIPQISTHLAGDDSDVLLNL